MAEFESCDKCKYDRKSEYDYPCNTCKHGVNIDDFFTPKTNADLIRAMSDEELANENIYFVSECALKEGFHYTGLDGGYYKTAKEAVEANMNWLKSEVKE